MLKKAHRGLSPSQVSKLFSAPHQTVANSFFRVNWAASSDTPVKFSIITPGSLTRSAVLRNRFRRRFSELVRLNFRDWTARLQVAILVKKAALTATPDQLRKALLSLLAKIS